MKYRFLVILTLLLLLISKGGYGQNLSALMDAINNLEKKLTKLIGQERQARIVADKKLAAKSGKAQGPAQVDTAMISAVENLKKALEGVQTNQTEVAKQITEITNNLKEIQGKSEDERVKEMAVDLKKLIDELKVAMKIEEKQETSETKEEESNGEETKKASFGGYLDSDVWTDFAGNFYTNDELDLGMSVAFSDKVSANVYMTVLGGAVPAGGGEPGDRWVSVLFDGVDITFDTKIGSFSVGDLVYQHGCFNYYLYKRLSMITPETFSRGIQYTIGNDIFSQSFLVAAADDADELISYHVVSTDGDTVAMSGADAVAEGNGGDISGTSMFTFNDDHGLSLFYGVRADVYNGYKAGGKFYAGLEYNGAFGDVFEMKFDFGYTNFSGEYNTIALLLEPCLTVKDFSTALTFYTLIDPDSANDVGGDPLFGVGDELFVYIEPGYSFTDVLAAGVPVEYHSFDVENTDDDELWIVPTFYVYPFGDVEWWIWVQLGIPFAEGYDTYYGLGSELIVNF